MTNRLHEGVFLDDLQRQVLQALDGKHNRDDLVKTLTDKVCCGDLVVHHEKRRVVQEEEVQGIVSDGLPKILEQLVRKALLVG